MRNLRLRKSPTVSLSFRRYLMRLWSNTKTSRLNTAGDQIVEKRKETIASLKQELEHASNLLQGAKNEARITFRLHLSFFLALLNAIENIFHPIECKFWSFQEVEDATTPRPRASPPRPRTPRPRRRPSEVASAEEVIDYELFTKLL